jgi:uncharacterized protein YtpQ (UPF0354 family)
LHVVQVMNATFMPVVASVRDPAYSDRHVFDVLFDDLVVGYSLGYPSGERLMTWQDFDRLRMSRRELRHRAAALLDASIERVAIHGQPPALMLSFEGIESSVLLCDEFWDGLEGRVPGSIVVGVPARDVVIVTGSRSPAGLAKARRAVDRMFFAGGRHLVRQGLLVRQHGMWQPMR